MIKYLSSSDPWKAIDAALGTRLTNTHHIVQYNIQPGDLLTILARTQAGWSMGRARWAWTAHDGSVDQKIINARVEGIFSQNAFRFAIRNRRCVIPVDGFYSVIQKPGKETMAYRITHTASKPLFAAAVASEDGKCVNPITAPAISGIEDVAERQLILFDNKADVQAWCDTALKVGQLDALLKRTRQLDLTCYAITADIVKDINTPILHERRHRHLTLFD